MIKDVPATVNFEKVLSFMGADEVKQLMKLCKARLNRIENPYELTEEEKELANSGQRIFAIKSMRARLGIGLMEAKDCVEYFTHNK